MSNSSALFSIVLTTRNRANLLPFAVQSVLQQTYGDFELIISDNFSTDNTTEIARSFNDDRIRYIRTSESLPINESYKFALSHARGEYITFLSDDDAYTIDLLKKAEEILTETKSRLVCWNYANYFLTSQEQPDLPLFHPLRTIEKNVLQIPTFSSGIYEVLANAKSGRQLLENYQSKESLLAPPPRGPQFTNAVYHHSIFENIKKRGIDLFCKSVLTDVYSGVVVVTEVEKYIYLDMPLTVFCRNENSATGDFTVDKEKYAKYFLDKEHPEEMILPPIKNLTNYNYLVSSILKAKNDFQERFEGIELDSQTYYSMYYSELMYYKHHGLDIEKELNDFHQALADEPQAMQKKIRSMMSPKLSEKFRQFLRKLPRPQVLTERIARSSPETIHHRSLMVNGADVGFGNITECGTWLNEKKMTELADFCVGLYNKRPTTLPYKWQIS